MRSKFEIQMIFLAVFLFTSFLLSISLAVAQSNRNVQEVDSSVQSKIESRIWDIYKVYMEKGKSVGLQFAKQRGVYTRNDKIKVIADFDGKVPSMYEFNRIGVVKDNVFIISRNQVQMLVLIQNLLELAKLSNIMWIQKGASAIPLVVSEGVNVIEASNYWDWGFSGQGVKVAIIDGGFAGYENLLGSELPSSVTTKSFYNDVTGNGDITGGGEIHGTACAEIIYDVAPQAELYLINFQSVLEFELAVDYAIEENVDIVSCSWGWGNTSNYDGTGPIANATLNAKVNGILWVNAAGNHAQRHYEGYFQDTDNNNLHEFGAGDETINIYANVGDTLQLYLSWNEWPYTANDYDLLLYEDDGYFVTKSYNRQTGSQPPTEAIEYGVLTSGTYHVKIQNFNADGTAKFELYSAEHELSDHRVASSSLLDPAPAQSVLAVGATSWQNDELAHYSSQGPSNDGRTKPDVTAPTGVSSYIYGTFHGTSASCPHVAGAAAVMLSQNPYLNPDQLQDYLENSATDLGDIGKDDLYGSGRVKLVCVNVNTPNGGEKLFAGELYDITWTTLGSDAEQVKLQYSIDGGNTWDVIPATVPNSGIYTWIVPSVSSTTCRVKIVTLDNDFRSLSEDISDSDVVICGESSNAAICMAKEDQNEPRIVTDGEGGAIIIWNDNRRQQNWDIYGQRINDEAIKQWDKDGIPIIINQSRNPFIEPTLIYDGFGGAIIAWRNCRYVWVGIPPTLGVAYEIYVQKVDKNGDVMWETNGIHVTPEHYGQGSPVMVSDGYGGAIIAWRDGRNDNANEPNSDIYAQRIDSNGNILWNNAGVPICTARENQLFLRIVEDGYGGAVIVWVDCRNGIAFPKGSDIYAQHINADGMIMWTKNGVPICTADDTQNSCVLIRDSSGSYVIVWEDFRENYLLVPDIYAQKINKDGVTQWQNNGVPVCTAYGGQFGPDVVADHSGGAIITWADSRWAMTPNIFAQRINSQGVSRWNNNGVCLSQSTKDQKKAAIISDEAGGGIICWQDARGGDWDIYAQRIDGNGIIQWQESGVQVCNAEGNQRAPKMISDGAGGAIAVWEDERWGSDIDIYAQHIFNNGTIPVELSNFSVLVRDNVVELNWTTVTESNSYGFEIERSTDRENFIKIGFVKGHGTTTMPQNYKFIDKDVSCGMTYLYRLKQIDFDGTYKYSDVWEAVISPPSNYFLSQNYPNPFNSETAMGYHLPKPAKVTLKIFNLLGQEIKTLVDEEKEAGYFTSLWNGKDNNGKDVATGIYIYRIEAFTSGQQRFVDTKKLILLR